MIACEWDNLSDFYNGLSCIQQGVGPDRLSGYADTTGRLVIPLQYSFATKFEEGAAVIGVGSWREREEPQGSKPGPVKPMEFVGSFGFIDTVGQEIVPPVYAGANPFSEGLAAVGRPGKYYVKWGYIDRSGTEVIPLEYFHAGPFSDGRAVVARIIGGSPKYGYIDRTGKEIVPCRYDSALEYRSGSMWVGEGSYPDCAYTLLDGEGHPLLDYKVYELDDSGYRGVCAAAVPDADGVLRYGVVDRKGRTVVPFEYDRVTIYTEWDDDAQDYVGRGLAERNGRKYPFTLK